jgi:hypothetical protein
LYGLYGLPYLLNCALSGWLCVNPRTSAMAATTTLALSGRARILKAMQSISKG